MNPSTWHPKVRRAVYVVLTVVGLAYGTALAFLGAQSIEPPGWLVGVGAAYAYLAAASGLMAAQNTPHTEAAQEAMQEVDAIGPTEPMAEWVEPETLPARFRDDDNDGIPDIKE